MNRITKDLSKLQLWLSLIIFIMTGTALCFYKVSSGVLLCSTESIKIDEISVVKPAYPDQNNEAHLPDILIKKIGKQSYLSRYIDSVINASGSIYLHKNNNYMGEDF